MLFRDLYYGIEVRIQLHDVEGILYSDVFHRIGWCMRTTRPASGSNNDTRYVNSELIQPHAHQCACGQARIFGVNRSPGVQNNLAACMWSFAT